MKRSGCGGSSLSHATFATEKKITCVQPYSRGSPNPPCSSPPTSITKLDESAVWTTSCIRSSCRIFIARRRANHQRNIVWPQLPKLRGNFLYPRPLALHARATIFAILMLLLYAIDDQISYRHTLLPQQFQISLRFADGHRFRNRHEGKTGLLFVVQEIAHGFDSLTEVLQEQIDFVRGRFATREVREDVAMFVAHQVE